MERRSSNVQSKETIMEQPLQQEWSQATLPAMQLEIEELEERIAPSQPLGLLGYEGQPGNQGGPTHHP
jgi:hypothetical protein